MLEHSVGASIAIVTVLGIGAQWLAWKILSQPSDGLAPEGPSD